MGGVSALTLHAIGAVLRVYVMPTEYYQSADLPYKGMYWVIIIFFGGPQVYLSRDVLCGHCNKMGQIQYDAEKQPWLGNIARFVNPFLAVVVFPGSIFILGYFRTTAELDDDVAKAFAFESGFAHDALLYFAWPYGFAVLLYLLYLYTNKNTHHKIHAK